MVRSGTALLLILISLAMLVSCSPSVVTESDTVTVHYTLTLDDGSVYYTTSGGEPVRYMLGQDLILSGFEEALIGMSIGETKTVVVPPEKAYGAERPELVVTMARDLIPPDIDLEIGKRLQTVGADNTPMIVTVAAFTEDTVTVDANHPLAGQDLTFQIELVSIAGASTGTVDARLLAVWLLAAGLVAVLFFFIRYRTVMQKRLILDGTGNGKVTEDMLIRDIVRLDAAYDNGHISREDYDTIRAGKKAEIRHLRGTSAN